MQTLADEVGGLMGQIMASSPLITREAAALTAALSICDDCHKNAERAAALAGKAEELEVEAELWQEEKVELLKSAVDTQKDAQLAEKAARLESENARLQEAVARLQEVEEENQALRQAAQEPDARIQALEAENAGLRENLDKLSETVRQNSDSLKLAENRLAQRLEENQGLRDRLEHMAQALKAAQEQPAAPAAAPRRAGKSRKNPLRREEEPMEQEGLQSFFAREENTP